MQPHDRTSNAIVQSCNGTVRQSCKSAITQRLPRAQAFQECKAAKAEAINCSAKGQGSAVGAITFLEVKQHGLEWKLLGSLDGARQGLFRAQQFSPLHHRVIDLLAAFPFIWCMGAQAASRAGSGTGPWEISGAGKVLRVWKSKLVVEMGNGGGKGDGRSLTLLCSLLPRCSWARTSQDGL